MTLFAMGVATWQDALALTWAATLVEVTAIAGPAWCAAMLTKAPAMRHRIWCAAMVAAFIASLATFLAVPRTAAPSAEWRAAKPASPTTMGNVVSFVWIGGALIGCATLAWSWIGLRRFSHADGSDLPEAWQEAYRQVSGRFGLAAEMRCSPAIAGAATFGWLRPTIVVARDLAGRWPQQHCQSVLAHEFEHIRRRDYVWGLLHSLWGSLFFFHPAAIWLCRAARREREFCCDDRAAGFAGGPATYVRILAELEAGRQPARPSLPIAGSLLARSERLLGARTPKRLESFAWLAASLAALACGAAVIASPSKEAGSGNPVNVFVCTCS